MPGHMNILAVLMLLLGALAGCASTPQASRQLDAEAKEFLSYPATSAIYVYRTDTYPDAANVDLYVDGRLIGAPLQKSFFRVDVNPGAHRLTGMGPDQGSLTLETRPDQIYFVEQHVIGSHSRFSVVPPHIARPRLLACCKLMENWAPGQRPLLR